MPTHRAGRLGLAHRRQGSQRRCRCEGQVRWLRFISCPPQITGPSSRSATRRKKAEGPAKPTIIIHRIENFLREVKEADKRTLRTLGKAQNVDKAIEIMEEEGSLIRTVEGNRHVFTLPPADILQDGQV